jgi:hypothetical protein
MSSLYKPAVLYSNLAAASFGHAQQLPISALSRRIGDEDIIKSNIYYVHHITSSLEYNQETAQQEDNAKHWPAVWFRNQRPAVPP